MCGYLLWFYSKRFGLFSPSSCINKYEKYIYVRRKIIDDFFTKPINLRKYYFEFFVVNQIAFTCFVEKFYVQAFTSENFTKY
jgi:hypothetical protein